jgi:hypothetical protein
VGALLSFAVLLGLARFKPIAQGIEQQTVEGLALDAVIVGIGCLAIWLVCRSPRARVGVAMLTGVLIVSQVLYTEQVYRLVGIRLPDILVNYGLDDADATPLPADVADDPNALERKQCTAFAECYLSERDSVSLRRDFQGTFLRSQNEPVFQEGLSDDATRAVSGITHPVFWLSASVQPYWTRSELVKALNTHVTDMDHFLASTTFVPAFQIPAGGFPPSPSDGKARLLTLSRRKDSIHLTYASSGSTYLNAAINHAPGWTATLNGQTVPVFDSEFGGILVPLPSGGGDVELDFRPRALDLFFYSRYLMAASGVIAILAIVWGGTLRRKRPSAST